MKPLEQVAYEAAVKSMSDVDTSWDELPDETRQRWQPIADALIRALEERWLIAINEEMLTANELLDFKDAAIAKAALFNVKQRMVKVK